MKIYKRNAVILTCFLLLITSSCKKTDIASERNSNLLAAQATINTAISQCRLTHTEDDLFGYTLDIFYNISGNPDSMSFYGSFPVKNLYDSKGRLTKTNFGTAGVRYEYIYKSNNILPASINYYYPYYSSAVNGLIAVYKFDYNTKDQIVRLGILNLLSPQYNASEKYEYNDQNNVTKVTYTSQDGTSSYVENEVSKYDDKLNFRGGNEWLKFILYNSEVTFLDYFRMLSKNNPTKYTWGFDGIAFPMSVDYEYNSQGLANKANFHLFDSDGVTDVLDFSTSSSFSCDATPLKSQLLFTKKKSEIPGKKSLHLPSTVPSRTTK